jgi:hypothetical protein
VKTTVEHIDDSGCEYIRRVRRFKEYELIEAAKLLKRFILGGDEHVRKEAAEFIWHLELRHGRIEHVDASD